jgi:hypothetical protein
MGPGAADPHDVAVDRFLEIYGSIGLLAGIVQAVYLCAAFSIGIDLLRRARRERRLPELLLGLHLLLSMGVGYLLVSAGVAAGQLSEEPPRHVMAPLLAAGYAATIVGLMATLVFTHRVFRPGQRLGLVFVIAASVVMWGGWLAYGASGGFSRGTFEGGAAWLLLGGMIAANGWVAFEPLHHYLQLRRRVRVGLADPVVTDRFLLWGLGSLARPIMILLGPVAEYGLSHTSGAFLSAVPPTALGLASILGLGTSVAFWLAFVPTAPYRRWVEARFARSAARA